MPEQPIADVEREIDDYITACRQTREAQTLLAEEPLCVIKYVPASYLTTILATGQLYASERAGFTWGDAIYAAPLKTPRLLLHGVPAGAEAEQAQPGEQWSGETHERRVTMRRRRGAWPRDRAPSRGSGW